MMSKLLHPDDPNEHDGVENADRQDRADEGPDGPALRGQETVARDIAVRTIEHPGGDADDHGRQKVACQHA